MREAISQGQEKFSTKFPYINSFERAYIVHLAKKYGFKVTLKKLFNEHIYSETSKLIFIEILELKIFSENLYYYMILNDIESYRDLINKFPNIRKTFHRNKYFSTKSYDEFIYKTIRNLYRLLILKNELSKNLNFVDFFTITEIKTLQPIYREFSLIEKRLIVGKRINLKTFNDLKTIGTKNISFKLDDEGKQFSNFSDNEHTPYFYSEY